MLEAKIHKEITEFEGKIFFGMTGKQIICVLIACAVVIPIFFLLSGSIGVELTGYICIIIAAPIMAVGFLKIKGRTFTEIVKMYFNFYLKNAKLKYVSNCDVDYLKKEVNSNGKGKRNNRKVKPGDECTETRLRYVAGTKKQLKAKRKENRRYFEINKG